MKRLSSGLLALLLPMASHASMMLDRSILTFSPGKSPREDVTVYNPDSDPMFIKVEVLEVQNPGTDKEARVPVRAPDKVAFIATPERLVVPPGGSRLIRLVNLAGNGDGEHVYRINVTPVVAPADASGSSSTTEKSVSIKILLAYQLLVFVAPAKPVAGLEGRREGKTLHLRNAGNVNVLLYEGRQCADKEAAAQCAAVPPVARLYPGNEVTVTLPREGPVDFTMEAAGTRGSKHFD